MWHSIIMFIFIITGIYRAQDRPRATSALSWQRKCLLSRLSKQLNIIQLCSERPRQKPTLETICQGRQNTTDIATGAHSYGFGRICFCNAHF